jgi:hypothetical protein
LRVVDSGYPAGEPVRASLSLSRRKGNTEGAFMAERSGIGGISLGGILVIIGIVVAIFWSLILGLIIALVGLIAFGGFARGKWY